MRIQVLVAVFAASLATAPAARAQFEGVVKGTIYGDGDKAIGDFTQYVKGATMRWDMPTPAGEVSSIVDSAKGTMTSLMHAQKMYMSMNVADVAGASDKSPRPGPPPKFTKTGTTETIAGHSCEHYLVGEKQDLDICAAKGLGFMGLAGGGSGPLGMGRGMPSLPPGYDALSQEFKDGFFPLKMEQVRGGKRSVRMLVSSVEPKPVDEGLFRIPAGYQEFKMPGIPTPKQ